VEARGPDVRGIAGRFDLADLDDVKTAPGAEARRTASLTDRELDVLLHLAEGQATEEIAELLCVSPHTIRSRIKTVLRKLDARNREHAVAIALTERAIQPKL
jgi:DNA-binding CsgD family transcriptional regulator